MKRLISILFFIVLTVSSYAQSFTLELDAPRVVAVGEAFRVEFVMNNKPSSFTAPSFEGFDISAGPSVSQSTSMSSINGKVTRNTVYTYSYVLSAQQKGNFTIGAAKADYQNKTYSSQPLLIEVVEEGGASASGNSSSNSGRGQTQAKTSVGKDDVLLFMELSKTNVYKGEAVLAKVKLLTRAQIVGFEGAKPPTFAGFWMQEIEDKRQKLVTTRETYNNKIYDAAVLKEYLLFPQQNGEINIDAMTVNVVVRVEDENAGGGSIFEMMAGGSFGSYRDLRRVLTTKPIKINVKPYPVGAPLSFNGAVGDFTMSSELSSDILTANSATNLILTIKGNGNLPLITEPALTLPTSFELYKIQTEESINVSNAGVVGQKKYTYPFIARAKGTYTLDPIEFTYFNPATAKFVTLKSESFKIAVSEDTSTNSGGGSGETIITGVTKEELKILGRDIQYIMTAVPELVAENEFFIFSVGYVLTVVGLIIVFVIALILLKKMIKEAKDTVRVKSKRANKVALNRLKEAKSFLHGSDSGAFYESVLKAMWGYVADKLNLEKASLSRDRVGEQLIKHGVSEEQKEQFLSVIASCEEARYSPVASSMMSDVYDNAMEVITLFENKL